jgi:hypothetical protein
VSDPKKKKTAAINAAPETISRRILLPVTRTPQVLDDTRQNCVIGYGNNLHRLRLNCAPSAQGFCAAKIRERRKNDFAPQRNNQTVCQYTAAKCAGG